MWSLAVEAWDDECTPRKSPGWGYRYIYNIRVGGFARAAEGVVLQAPAEDSPLEPKFQAAADGPALI
jgi:hypothetical protein